MLLQQSRINIALPVSFFCANQPLLSNSTAVVIQARRKKHVKCPTAECTQLPQCDSHLAAGMLGGPSRPWSVQLYLKIQCTVIEM